MTIKKKCNPTIGRIIQTIIRTTIALRMGMRGAGAPRIAWNVSHSRSKKRRPVYITMCKTRPSGRTRGPTCQMTMAIRSLSSNRHSSIIKSPTNSTEFRKVKVAVSSLWRIEAVRALAWSKWLKVVIRNSFPGETMIKGSLAMVLIKVTLNALSTYRRASASKF